MNLPRLELDPIQRRALVNGGVAACLTLVLGLTVQAALRERDGRAVATPPPSESVAPTGPPCDPTWDVVQAADPDIGLPHTLSSVTIISSAESWAVGSSGDATSPDEVLLERWDGTAWTAETVRGPGSETNELQSVDQSEPNDVWAVGRTASGLGDLPLVFRYDGTAWNLVAVPDEVTGVLTAVEAIAPNDVWAVGYSGNPAASLNRAMILHWDGEAWDRVDAGRALGVGASLLNDVTALGPDNVWAVGTLHNRPLMIHFDGRRWERSASDVRGIANAIEPLRSGSTWVVGSPIQRFDGSTWTTAATIPGDGELASVAAVAGGDVWAVGARRGAGGQTRSLVMRYDGQRWTPVDGPSVPGSDALAGVDALPDGTVLAVGYHDVQAERRTLAVQGTACGPSA